MDNQEHSFTAQAPPKKREPTPRASPEVQQYVLATSSSLAVLFLQRGKKKNKLDLKNAYPIEKKSFLPIDSHESAQQEVRWAVGGCSSTARS